MQYLDQRIRQYIISVEPISQLGSEIKSNNDQATIKVRTRPPGPPDPPQSPVIEEDPINSKNVIIRWLPVTLDGKLTINFLNFLQFGIRK